ncbi:MAG: hypothetical protein CMJ35_08035 [Phycisphaerae bacterium]|nr:hypothetical protein [Phycisphaerae bacterium]MBM91547.1 hypothetical protein [Phycisphaerae bacterium]HCT44404.1 hypothetical protein [Phycisphaerales bacterium]
MVLPKVLMTDVVRSSQQGDSHGGAYLIDLQRGEYEQVLDWDRIDISWEGRGQGRGLRGICFVGDEIFIAASDELFVFNQSFDILRSYKSDYLHHCHEICYDGHRYIYLSSTSFDSVLRFDTREERFDRGWWMRPMKLGSGVELRATVFDPNEPDGPPHGDHLHLNNVCYTNGVCMFSGLAMNMLASIIDDKVRPYAIVPPTTHNCQPLGKGVVMNSTGQDALVLGDRSARVLKKFEYPRYKREELSHADIPGDYARQAFGRGLCVDRVSKLLIAGSSPGTVSAFSAQKGEMVATLQVSNDLRNAPHGLEIWPY